MTERPYNWKNGIFNPSCVCGGSINNPNDDCERCAFHDWIYKQAAEIQRLRKALSDLPPIAYETHKADRACVLNESVQSAASSKNVSNTHKGSDMASKQETCPFCGARKVFGSSDGSRRFNCGTTGPDTNGEYDTGHCCDLHTYNRLLAKKDDEIALLRKALSDVRQLRRADPVPWLEIDAILEDALGG